MSNLSPELQALVNAKEAAYVKPRYFLGDVEVKVMRERFRVGNEVQYRWYEINDEILLDGSITTKNIRREPPFCESDNFA